MSQWKKNGKGPAYVGHYVRDSQGERVMVLIRILENGKAHTVTAESHEMLKKMGWKKVR